jgi:hypothetical protein
VRTFGNFFDEEGALSAAEDAEEGGAPVTTAAEDVMRGGVSALAAMASSLACFLFSLSFDAHSEH